MSTVMLIVLRKVMLMAMLVDDDAENYDDAINEGES